MDNLFATFPYKVHQVFKARPSHSHIMLRYLDMPCADKRQRRSLAGDGCKPGQCCYKVQLLGILASHLSFIVILTTSPLYQYSTTTTLITITTTINMITSFHLNHHHQPPSARPPQPLTCANITTSTSTHTSKKRVAEMAFLSNWRKFWPNNGLKLPKMA